MKLVKAKKSCVETHRAAQMAIHFQIPQKDVLLQKTTVKMNITRNVLSDPDSKYYNFEKEKMYIWEIFHGLIQCIKKTH